MEIIYYVQRMVYIYMIMNLKRIYQIINLQQRYKVEKILNLFHLLNIQLKMEEK